MNFAPAGEKERCIYRPITQCETNQEMCIPRSVLPHAQGTLASTTTIQSPQTTRLHLPKGLMNSRCQLWYYRAGIALCVKTGSVYTIYRGQGTRPVSKYLDTFQASSATEW